MERVFVYGAGDHARVILDAIKKENRLQVVGLVDDGKEKGARVMGYPVIGGRDAIVRLRAQGVSAAVMAIGNNEARRSCAESLRRDGLRLVSVIHPAASVADDVAIGDGSVILAGAVVDPDVTLGRGCIVNTRAIAGHTSRLGEYVHLAPGVCLGAYSNVGAESLLGMGAIILPGRRIGEKCTVGAGSVVTRDVSSQTVVVGNPARSMPRPESGVAHGKA